MELDELYWFVGEKGTAETKENTYAMTMVSRMLRQIVGFEVAFDKSHERIQKIVDSAPPAEVYCTDGWLGYLELFVKAYNDFGIAKMKYRQNRNPKSRELPFSVLNFL